MIKILFFIENLSEGGAEKVLRNLVNNMDQTKFDITVQTVTKCDAQKYLNKGIRYKAINKYENKILNKLFSYWFRLCAELKIAYRLYVKDDYDIEVAYLETFPTKIIAQSTNKKSKKLAWIHCDLSKKEGMNIYNDKVYKQYKKFDKIVCVSKDVKDGFNNIYGMKDKTEVIRNIIDEDEILTKSLSKNDYIYREDCIKFIALGRLSTQKNYDMLLDVCFRLKNNGYKFELKIAGDGPERNKLQEKIYKLGLEKDVSLIGKITNPYPVMKEADVVLCSSRYEGFSTVLLEAMILGKAIVTVDCTGMKELFGDTQCAIITENSEEGLYGGIERFINRNDLITIYGEKAKERSYVFSKNENIKLTQRYFDRVIRK